MVYIPSWFQANIVLYSLSALILLVAPFLWYKLRHTRVIKSRTTIIDLIYWVTGVIALVISALRSLPIAYKYTVFKCADGIVVAYLVCSIHVFRRMIKLIFS